ncbi:hypothetical protein [Streptomyces parvulus]|uniref:hypothetical protein n=1 Tax=Streptomyces parvulus TaxID=146923 RepID=UPI0033A205A8
MTNFIENDDEMELYAMLGLMVRIAADLELRLQMVAIHLAESPYAHLWVHGTRADASANLLRDLAKVHPRVTEVEREALDALLKRLRPLLDRRHGYVHGAWSLAPEGGGLAPGYQAMRFTKGREEPRFDPLSKEDLGDLIVQFSNLLTELHDWFVRHLRPASEPDGA